MTTYTGFSTYNRDRKFKVVDFDLIKQDLFNHFNIRKGEKLMNPNFGTIIWGLIFEPFTTDIHDLIIADVKSIIAYDPRVQANSITITEFEHGIQLDVELIYVVTNQVSTMSVNFDRASGTVS
jgi:phage baseplate assembly protein W